jgi:hypothetical protein
LFILAQVRRQHRLNLGAVMRHAMLRCDYCTAAGAVGALLACQVRLAAGKASSSSSSSLRILALTAMELAPV